MNEKELLERAHRWFTITYAQTAEKAGLRCAKIWYKPIMGYSLRVDKYAEVVLGPDEKEVNAFIKAQTLLRRSFNWTLILLLLNGFGLIGMMYTIAVQSLDAMIAIVVVFGSVDLITAVVFLWLAVYVKSLEEMYLGKIVTFMDR